MSPISFDSRRSRRDDGRELYLDGQSTSKESTVFTGYRWENRFRPLLREHWINPVLYVEFENINGADKTPRDAHYVIEG